MNQGTKKLAKEYAEPLTNAYYQYLRDTLRQDPRSAHSLAQEVQELIPKAKDRQIYKLLYPFAEFKCIKQLQYLNKTLLIDPILQDDFALFRGPNQYSMLFMSLGYQFFIEDMDRRNKDKIQERKQQEEQNPEDRPFRYSLFQKLSRDIKEKHLEQLRESRDYDVIIFMLYTYVLNNSRDTEVVDMLIDNVMKNLTEDQLSQMHENRSGTLSKVLSLVGKQRERVDEFKEYQQMCQKVHLKLHTKKTEQNQRGDTPQNISRENVFVREVLTAMLGQDGFREELYLEDSLIQPDFYIPKSKLCIEVNGKNKFYPYSTRYNNFTNFKHKIALHNDHNVVHLNSWKLEGMMKYEDGRKNLTDLLTRTIQTYEDKIKNGGFPDKKPVQQPQE
eukprot:403333962